MPTYVTNVTHVLYLDTKYVSAITTSSAHSKLDCCNSLYYNLTKVSISKLQSIQNAFALKSLGLNLISTMKYLNLAEF